MLWGTLEASVLYLIFTVRPANLMSVTTASLPSPSVAHHPSLAPSTNLDAMEIYMRWAQHTLPLQLIIKCKTNRKDIVLHCLTFCYVRTGLFQVNAHFHGQRSE